MASTFTQNISIERPDHGGAVDTWDVPVNADWDTIDTVFGGVTNINAVAASGTVVLTLTQYRPRVIVITGLLTANVNYQFPSGIGGQWSIYNNTTGAFSITTSSGGGGLSLTILQGFSTLVWCDGTNVRQNLTAPLNAQGSNGYVQFNNNGALSGSGFLTFNNSNSRLTVGALQNQATSVLDPNNFLCTMENANGAAGIFCYTGSALNTVSLSARVESTQAIPFGIFYGGSNVGGIMTNGSTITIYGTSDSREKDIENEYDPGDLFDRIKIYNYRWKTGDKALGIGPLAQELYEEAPSLVIKGDSEAISFDGESYRPWRSHVSEIEAMIMAELKSLRARMAELEAK